MTSSKCALHDTNKVNTVQIIHATKGIPLMIYLIRMHYMKCRMQIMQQYSECGLMPKSVQFIQQVTKHCQKVTILQKYFLLWLSSHKLSQSKPASYARITWVSTNIFEHPRMLLQCHLTNSRQFTLNSRTN